MERQRFQDEVEETARPARPPPVEIHAGSNDESFPLTAPSVSGSVASGHGLPVRVGNYLLTREIAIGGMGTVYEAVQDRPRRVVALKLLRRGRQLPGQQKRFEFESQVLARMRHAGIAQVFEAGTHDEGERQVPYFAMEFIPGALAITRYAEVKKLSIEQRLSLFAPVCDAVHYANSKGIIHRDLKPGNILIDAQGQPKVIDFGVARASDSDQFSATMQTDASQLIGTLQYMSPEQCDSDPRELDARSDVYALGVVLYEMLCGRLPYDLSKINVSDATRIIREQPPERPSAIEPGLRGDIETVLLKALHKDRARRYQSAAELAHDIRNLLAGEAIGARRDSAVYVARVSTRRFTRRHRVIVTAGALIFAFLALEKFGPRLVGDGNRKLEQFYIRYFSPTPAKTLFESVRVVAIKDGTDVQALASGRVEGVTAKDIKSLRLLHGWLLERLAKTDVGVVAWDIGYATPSPYDEPLINGVRSMREHGREIVFACGLPSIKPQLIPELASIAKYGPTTFDFSETKIWNLHLAVRKTSGVVVRSLPLQAVTAFWRPGADTSVNLDLGSDVAKVQYIDADSGVDDLIPLNVVVRQQMDNKSFGLSAGDWIGYYVAPIPPQEALDAVTLDYADVIRADDAQLKQWFDGKVVVVGDFRDRADRHRYADGREIAGPYVHASVIDSLLRHEAIQLPRQVKVLSKYVYISGWYLFDGAAALVGILIASLLINRSMWGRVAVAVAAIGVLAVSIGAFHFQRTLFPPLLALVALVISAEIVFAAVRLRKAHPA